MQPFSDGVDPNEQGGKLALSRIPRGIGKIFVFIEAITVAKKLFFRKATVLEGLTGKSSGTEQAKRFFELGFLPQQNCVIFLIFVVGITQPEAPALGRNRFVTKAGVCVRPFEHRRNSHPLRSL